MLIQPRKHKEFLSAIRQNRRARGLTQKQLGKRIGIQASVISALESKRPGLYVSDSRILKIGGYLKLKTPIAPAYMK